MVNPNVSFPELPAVITPAQTSNTIQTSDILGGSGTLAGTTGINIGSPTAVSINKNSDKAIIVNDGTNDVILIGFQKGGF